MWILTKDISFRFMLPELAFARRLILKQKNTSSYKSFLSEADSKRCRSLQLSINSSCLSVWFQRFKPVSVYVS